MVNKAAVKRRDGEKIITYMCAPHSQQLVAHVHKNMINKDCKNEINKGHKMMPLKKKYLLLVVVLKHSTPDDLLRVTPPLHSGHIDLRKRIN